MERLKAKMTPITSTRLEDIEYLLDMIAELASMARRTGEPGVAIHLEAILAARRAEATRASLAC